MQPVLLIAAVIIAILLCIQQLLKWKHIQKQAASSKAEPAKVLSTQEQLLHDAWWAQLDLPVQLELAIALARKALPVWKKYSELHGLVYKNSPAGQLINIDQLLLKQALDVTNAAAGKSLTIIDPAVLNCYSQFVAPLIALQDGNWSVPYPVKKIFLSVYNILQAVKEQENSTMKKNLLYLSINQSLDCLDLSRLYSSEEIVYLLNSYKGPAAQNS